MTFITRRTEAETEHARLVDEQAALRRVATLVAKGTEPGPLFDALAGEVERLFGADISAIVRFEDDGTATVMGAHGGTHSPGARVRLDPEYVVAAVYRTGEAASFDLEVWPGEPPVLVRDWGLRSARASPILVEGRVWGAFTIASYDTPLGAGTERRLADFSALFATAIANAQSREALAELAEEQGALHRVATLVAEGVAAQEVFDTVCQETCRLLGATTVTLEHANPDGSSTRMAGWSRSESGLPLEAGTVTAPIVVEGRLWGALVAGTDRDEPLAAGTDLRLARFAELVATAIANAATRSELIASRARIVAAGDEARQRIERNLHDGTQQRLIALGLDLQRIRATIPEQAREAHLGLERAEADLQSVLDDLRELSRGLHPPLLARRGLRPALRALARDSPIPVKLEIDLPERPQAPFETAVYYVVSESLTNAIKHSEASGISIKIETDHAGEPFGVGLDGRGRGVNLHATIADDGVGGADPSAGSGLTGLADRVDALGGRFVLDTPGGGGTRISVELPFESR